MVLFHLGSFLCVKKNVNKLYVKAPMGHCCFRHPGDEFQIGPNWDLSKALNNQYRLL